MDEMAQVIQDLHMLVAHDPSPQHKVVYTQCLQALLKIQAEQHQAGQAAQQANPQQALLSMLHPGDGGGQAPAQGGVPPQLAALLGARG